MKGHTLSRQLNEDHEKTDVEDIDAAVFSALSAIKPYLR
jgi:hypothetical protein